MKKIKQLFTIILLVIIAGAVGCGAYNGGSDYGDFNYSKSFFTGNEYNEIAENPFMLVSENPTSSFAMDSNTAAYSNIRRYINEYRAIDKNMVRIEEMVNYFRYDYALPEEGEPLAINGDISPCPWNNESRLLTIGVRAEDVKFEETKNNLVFLMDISGSMDMPDKLPLMQAAFCMLSENLNDNDYVSIVTYAGQSKTVLSGARGFERKRIQNAVEDITAGGSTAGAQGIETAYELCGEYFIEDGNNRIILATDGDFNVGISSQDRLEDFIIGKSGTGIDLTILGFGYGNLKDNKLETLANSTHGSYAYIDNILEARRLLVEQIGGTLETVAKDVKAQVEFNPLKVKSYRLLGYENKLITEEEWDDPDKIAGDIGAGHCVTAVYEIVLNENWESVTEQNFLKISLRFKDPDTSVNREITADIKTVSDLMSNDIKFISAVVEAALVMRDSVYRGTASLQSVIERLESIENLSNDPYKREFLELIKILMYNY